ncbi:DUF5956 family protein [Streptomyces sp. NPDC058619]|uniref:DUF5956 family protein n=1 Tax=unclassified Streptomyces TaxID=2593676 RepID=UPI003660D5FC
MSWDEDGTPHPLAQRRSGRSEQEPDRLPEVRELEALGWERAPEGARWAFLPYVWPAPARTWVPDRSTRWAVETSLDGHGHITAVECAPLAGADLAGLDREADEALAALGLPPRPPGRLWLLRPLGDLPTLEAVLAHLDAAATARALNPHDAPALLTLTRTELTALATTPPAQADGAAG